MRNSFLKSLMKRVSAAAPLMLAITILFSCMFTAHNVDLPDDSMPPIQLGGNVVIRQGNLETEVWSDGDTVFGLLTRAGIRLEKGDGVTPSLITQTSGGMEIVIDRKNTTQVTVEETAEYATVMTPSVYMEKGTEVLVTSGQNGKKLTTYEIFTQDGVELYRCPVAETIIEPTVDEVIEYGSGGVLTTPDGKELGFTKVIDVTATAYSTEGWKNKRTASGTIARVGAIAVDPKVIPLGTMVYVECPNGNWIYGESVCEDTGGAIKGNIIDLFFNTQRECYKFGRKPARVYILE